MDSEGTQYIVSHPYDWRTGTDDATGNTVIHCWTLDQKSKPHLLRFHDFDIFCYVELPLILNNAYVSWTQHKISTIYDAICFKLNEDRPYRYKFVKKEKLYFYKGKNKTYPMLLLCFKSIEAMKKCKNKLKFPFKVRGLKGGSEQTMVSLRVWETEIPVVRKLLTLKNCKFSQWFKISGIRVTGEDKISSLENEFVVDWKTLDPIPPEETMTWLTQPKILSFDLETYSDRHNAMPDAFCSKHVIYMASVVCQRLRDPSSRTTEIILLGDCAPTNLANVIKVKTEMELIETLEDLIIKHDPEIISGYNILGYDNPYLETRLKRRMKEWKCLGRLLNKPTTMKTMAWSSSAYKNQEFNILEMDGRISIDLLPVIKRDFKLPLYKLDFVANHFLGKGKHDVTARQMFETYELQECLNGKPEKIPDAFLKACKTEDPEKEWEKEYRNFALEEMKKVIDYCVVDSDLVVDLFEKVNVWIGLISMSNIMGVTPEEIFTRGTGVRMTSQIYDEASRHNTVLDEVDFPKVPYEGGFVFEPISGLYSMIACLDFSSLYPNIMITENIDHKTLVPPELMDKIPDEDCYVIEWSEENEGEKAIQHKVKFVKEDIGLMPGILRRLIAERNKVRKKQRGLDKDSLEWNILEQTQLGIKIICNSFYGSCGSSYSKLRLPVAAAAITAQARKSTKKMNAYLESKGHKIIYGDSVTGDTPILISRDGKEEYIYISDLVSWEEGEGKQYTEVNGVKVWSDLGFTDIRYVMRHKTKKRIFCIVTTSGIVKVTEDHSLLDFQGKEVSPKDVKIGDILLTKEHPNKKGRYAISENALEASSNLVEGNVSYNYIDGSYIMMKGKEEVKGQIKRIIDLGYIDDYVYDLETGNHHFSAGVGELVVHNTDSTMPDLGLDDPKTAWAKAEEIAKELTGLFRKPMNVEMEAIFHTMLSIKKKMYLCILMDKNGNPIEDPDKMKIRGVTLARRDNCKFQRDFYKQAVWKVMHREPFMDMFNFIIDKCIELASHSVPWEDLVMIKGLGDHYKSKTYMMNIFSQEMEKSGNPLVPGDRIPYLVVENLDDDPEKEKIGYRMRTVELFKERAESDNPEHIDYLHYLEKTICNGIQKQLFQIGYKKELEELEKRYLEIDEGKVLDELRRMGHGMILDSLEKRCSTNQEILDYLLGHAKMSKIVKPLYNYHVRRRQGRSKRLSSRIDREPVMMMVSIMKKKKEVMEEIRNRIPKPNTPKSKILKLKVISPENWISNKTQEMKRRVVE